ncbi:apolipoprotein N-acyltransferase [Ancylobacter dichloromethanicus]|uniref:Apolipoprotein N-acyltransferase n=1 Tax=Ancylobacter dichloromethanicus TaxID=518825 RepID=A0A9W6J8S4_9HYPH|nr:apolipoprotein N-acyltransferase [Ancylobacter dichloromethanicus]MBS7552571.1 apolipoprotein N-acyltransferase [Ancylobacter dichloromethanicus]GLK71931.1 apolipoprotein N-acyltransferase [Ancylobacter dichloromethanicus]
MLMPGLLQAAPARWRALAALLAGGLSALAMPPFGLWPVLALTLPVLVFLIDATAGLPLRRALGVSFLAGWLFGLGYFVAGLWWIGEAFLVQADAFLWLMPFAVIGLPAYLALYTGLGCALARLAWTAGPGRILVFALALTVTEVLRGTLLTGFPWNDFGYALATDLRFAQGASVIGLTGLCLVTLATLAAPAALFDAHASSRARHLPLGLAVGLLAALWAGGQWRLASTEVGSVPGVTLRLMQPDLPQDQKFRYDARRTVMDLYLATSEGQGGLAGVTHLFWPESAFPFFLEREPEALARMVAMLPRGTTLVTGAARYQAVPGRERPDVFNSVRVIDSSGAIRGNADKVHLVPFGEYLPFQETLEAIGLEALTRVRGGFAAATSRHLLDIPGLPPAVPLICYEAIFPDEVMPADLGEGARPGFLLNLSNDAWFGITPGPYQHFEQSRLRAIEQGLPLVRVTNNGISAIVDPIGRIRGILPLGARGVLDGSLPQALPGTIYASFGSKISWLLVLGLGLVAFMLRMRDMHA